MRNKDVMTLDGIVEKITSMGQVVAILHVVSYFSFIFELTERVFN